MDQLSEFTTTVFRLASAEPWWLQKEAVAAGPSFSSEMEYVEDVDTTLVIVQPHEESIGSEIANGPTICELNCSVVPGRRCEDCYATNSGIPSLKPALRRNSIITRSTSSPSPEPSLKPALRRYSNVNRSKSSPSPERVRFAVDVHARPTGSEGAKARNISPVRHFKPNCRVVDQTVFELAKLHARVARGSSLSGMVNATSFGKVKIMPTTMFVV